LCYFPAREPRHPVQAKAHGLVEREAQVEQSERHDQRVQERCRERVAPVALREPAQQVGAQAEERRAHVAGEFDAPALDAVGQGGLVLVHALLQFRFQRSDLRQDAADVFVH